METEQQEGKAKDEEMEIGHIQSSFDNYCFSALSPLPPITPMRAVATKDIPSVSPVAPWSFLSPLCSFGPTKPPPDRCIHRIDFTEERSFFAAEISVKILRDQSPMPQMEIPNHVSGEGCNCSKSQCLKMYCECFAAGKYCTGCSCDHCYNTADFEERRQVAISGILEKNPQAFQPKIAIEGEPRHQLGCNCKKSNCIKKYCECFQRGVLCCDVCKCCSCKNAGEKRKKARIH